MTQLHAFCDDSDVAEHCDNDIFHLVQGGNWKIDICMAYFIPQFYDQV